MFIAPSAEPPFLMFVLDVQPFQNLMDMINTLVVSAMVISSSSYAPLASYVGSSPPPTKKEVEVGPSGNEGRKRSPPSSQGGPVMTCYVLVTKPVPASPEFVTTPESFKKPSGESQAQHVLSTKNRHGAPMGCMFNFMDEVLTLSAIFMNLLNLTPQDLSGEDLEGPSSLALVARSSDAPPLNIPPL